MRPVAIALLLTASCAAATDVDLQTPPPTPPGPPAWTQNPGAYAVDGVMYGVGVFERGRYPEALCISTAKNRAIAEIGRWYESYVSYREIRGKVTQKHLLSRTILNGAEVVEIWSDDTNVAVLVVVDEPELAIRGAFESNPKSLSSVFQNEATIVEEITIFFRTIHCIMERHLEAVSSGSVVEGALDHQPDRARVRRRVVPAPGEPAAERRLQDVR